MEQVNTLRTLVARRYSVRKESIGDRRGARVGPVTGGLIVTIGALLAGGGSWLLILGGSPYYILSGIAYVVAGVLLWRRRPAGAWLATAVFAATVAWALWEEGLNYWALFPRLLNPSVCQTSLPCGSCL